VATEEPAEPDVALRTTRSSVKKVSQTQPRNTERAKKAKETDVSLEAHASTVSSDDVSNSSLLVSDVYALLFLKTLVGPPSAEVCRTVASFP
jgi:hypothetical protein